MMSNILEYGDHHNDDDETPEPGPCQPVIKMNVSSLFLLPPQLRLQGERPKMSSTSPTFSLTTKTVELTEEYSIGAYCRAVWEEDNGEYEVKVIDIVGNFAIVRFVGFGNEEEVELSKLKPSLGKGAQELQIVAAHEYAFKFNINVDFNPEEPDVIWYDAKSTFSAPGIVVEKINPQYINENFNIGFVGTGETLKNVAFPLIDKCVLDPKNVIVFGINVDHLKPWEEYSCQTSTSLASLLTNSNIIIWSCNSKTFPKLCDQASKVVTKMNLNSLHVTLIEDLSLEDFKNQLKASFQLPNAQHMFRTARIVPLIFNKMDKTKTASLYIPGSKPREVPLKEKEIILKMFGQSGMCFEIKEPQINGYKTLIQNGMSLIFPLVETLSDCGLKVGIPRSNSTQIVSHLMASAATSILSQPNNNLQEIKDVILKPGGASITGVLELEKSGVRSSFINAFNAMYRKENDLNNSKRKNKDKS